MQTNHDTSLVGWPEEDVMQVTAAVTSKPLVLSHTSLITRPRPFTRLITPEHAKSVAGTGGVIGIWPVKTIAA